MDIVEEKTAEITEYIDIVAKDINIQDRDLLISKVRISLRSVGDKRYSEGYNEAIEAVTGAA